MRPRERTRRGALLALLALGLESACGVRKEVAVVGELRGDLQRELGVDANVNVNEFSGKLVVTITLQSRPAGDLDVARERAVAIARLRLPRATRVDVFTRL